MNIQTERLENHIARVTVEIDQPKFEQARQKAVRKISGQVNIPGFRKGKVPQHIIQRYFGEAAIVEEALELIGDEVYKAALEETGLEPYGMGKMTNVEGNPPKVTFEIALQPTVDLKDYRSVRKEWSVPEVTDEMVERSVQMLREQNGDTAESSEPVALGNRVTVDMYAALLDQPEVAHDHDHEHDEHHDHGLGDHEFIHEHDAVMVLGEENEEPAPGFKAALVGATAGEEREFEVTYPDDKEEYEDLAGKRAKFKVTVKKIETIALPELGDEFAAKVTAKDAKQLTMTELREQLRENLVKGVGSRAEDDYAREVLEEMVERAEIAYPEAMVDDEIEDYFVNVDRELQRQGMNLDSYLKVTKRSKAELGADYQDTAIRSVRRAVVLREIFKAEGVKVDGSLVDAELDRIISQFGENAESLRSVFDTPEMRENILNDLSQKAVMARIAAIARGDAPEVGSAVAVETTETQQSTGDSHE